MKTGARMWTRVDWLQTEFSEGCVSCVYCTQCVLRHALHILPIWDKFMIYLTMIFIYIGYTGRFIMFSVITNIYNKKTKGPTFMELFTATGKLTKFFSLTTRDVRCVHHGWHGTHRYDIQVLATHTHQHGCIDIPSFFSKLFIPRMNGLVCRRFLCVLCTKCALHINHRLIRVIFQNTKWLLPPNGHFLTTYTRIA